MYMSFFCKYKNLFGEPNTGLRQKYRIFNISLPDLLPTILFAYLFSVFTKFSFYYTLVLLFIIMVFFHRIFCVRSTTDKLLFPDK